MFDPLFSLVDPIADPVVEMSEDTMCFVIPAETFFDCLENTGLDTMGRLPESATIAVPLDIVMSLLRPHELEKLQKYIASYLAKYGQECRCISP